MKKLNAEFSAHNWDKFYFIISPDEFEQIFGELPAVFVARKKVDEPLQTVPKSAVFDKYNTLFYNILSKKCKGALMEGWFQESIIDDLDKVQVEPIPKDDKRQYVFQSLRPAEPFIDLSPFDLIYLSDKKRVSLAYHNPCGVLGMSLNYPKAIAWNFTKMQATDDFAMRKIFDKLIKDIKKICKKAKIQRGEILFKPNLWISENAKKQINSNVYLQENHLVFI